MSNHKTPNFAYGNFSFQEKGFNMGYRVRYAHPNFAYGKTIHIPNIMFNKSEGLKR